MTKESWVRLPVHTEYWNVAKGINRNWRRFCISSNTTVWVLPHLQMRRSNEKVVQGNGCKPRVFSFTRFDPNFSQNPRQPLFAQLNHEIRWPSFLIQISFSRVMCWNQGESKSCKEEKISFHGTSSSVMQVLTKLNQLLRQLQRLSHVPLLQEIHFSYQHVGK